MKRILVLIPLIVLISACTQALPDVTRIAPSATAERKTPEATFTSLPYPCATPAPAESNDFIKQSITLEDNGKTFTTHVTSRFWIYLDDRIYPLADLLDTIPQGLIGYVSNGSVRGPQCYPVMFEALKEGKELLQLKDFQLQIVVDDAAPQSTLPLP
jgi:hypothetical protein